MAQFNSLLVTGDSRFINPINGNARNGIYYVKGTQTAATGSWTGVIPVPALYDGLTISYYLPYAGSGGATLNLTLSDGTTTGAVNCYYQGNSRLTTHYGAGSNIMLTYHPAGAVSVSGTATTDNRWVAGQNYADGNDQAYQVRDYYNSFKVGANKVFPYTIIMQNADGRWESIVTSSSTGTSKARNTHGFRLGQIALMYYNATYNENAILDSATVWESYTSGLVDHRYSFNTANNSTSGTTANKPVYLVGVISSDGLFRISDTWWTQTLPSTDDGKLYIYLGDAYDYYRMSFRIHHPVYHYTNGKIRQFAQDAATVSGHTVAQNVTSTAALTDTQVRQTLSTANTNRPLLMSYDSTSSTASTVTGISYRSNKIYANASTGNVQVATLNGYTPTGVWVGTQAQYDAITTPDTNVTYYITDGYAPPTPNAGVIGYSNTSSGLFATTVQGAIDETAGAINNNKVKSVMLTTSVTSTYSDGATIGYRGTGPNINTLTGYPTGKNILCAYVEYSYVSSAIYPALSHIVNNVIYVTSKSSGSVNVGVRVLYTETT